MRLFIETLMHLIKLENMSQSDLVDLCNKNGKKDGLQISKGAISNYKQGRFPEPAYAALLIRNVSKDVNRRNELAVAYLRDVANELGISSTEVDIVNLRSEKIDRLRSLPVGLRERLTNIGHASIKTREVREMVHALNDLSIHMEEKVFPGLAAKPSTRGVKQNSRTAG